MSCPVVISHVGTSLSPLSLFTLLTAITNHTHVHPLLFRHEEHEFSIDFRPSISVFTPDEMKNRTKHPSSFCHFQGANRAGFRAWLSVCPSNLTEMIMHTPVASFTMMQANGTFDLVPSGNHSCDLLRTHFSKRGTSVNSPPKFVAWKQSPPEYYKDYSDLLSRKRYVEYAMFGDYSLYKMYNKNEQLTAMMMLKALHMMNSYYDSLNIEIRLAHLTVIKQSIFTYENHRTTLTSFQELLFKNFKSAHWDHANLMIGGYRISPELGVAFYSRICSSEHLRFSISYAQDAHTSTVSFEAAKNPDVSYVMAHELGHALGMMHDEEGDNRNCKCPMQGCIMIPKAIEGVHLQYWSSCSLANLDKAFKSGGDFCLWNEPRTEDATTCGNGIVERGEDCDCGQLGCITHDCCDATTCKFRAGAKCASGSCCDVTTCSVAASTRMCRDAKNTCDLPEFCDGISTECEAADKHRPDGEKCPDDQEAICYGGRCGSRKLQCKEIWGEHGKPSPESCYKSNVCKPVEFTDGGSHREDPAAECADADAQCGLLYCSVNKLNAQELSDVFTGWTYVFDDDNICMRLVVDVQRPYQHNYYMGMTPDGTSCGHGKMCLKQKCVTSPFKSAPDNGSTANLAIYMIGFLVIRV